ncbi:hypothetical protein EXIGLDRAFT_480210 [Exidia glandulosa HHB12029]|uniref:Uncharacterized protein n=1 Tax=Exidia glandulosa HHB12029 TaxID=1314781 RepID=A0A165JSV2_EXIGL|nr:hypothetical protein EXIGLDRAFT_480210 [Exidia glandulosa HHB12029]
MSPTLSLSSLGPTARSAKVVQRQRYCTSPSTLNHHGHVPRFCQVARRCCHGVDLPSSPLLAKYRLVARLSPCTLPYPCTDQPWVCHRRY